MLAELICRAPTASGPDETGPIVITCALLDGPFALDNAISPEAAKIEKINSPAPGRANNVLVANSQRNHRGKALA